MLPLSEVYSLLFNLQRWQLCCHWEQQLLLVPSVLLPWAAQAVSALTVLLPTAPHLVSGWSGLSYVMTDFLIQKLPFCFFAFCFPNLGFYIDSFPFSVSFPFLRKKRNEERQWADVKCALPALQTWTCSCGRAGRAHNLPGSTFLVFAFLIVFMF